MSQTPDHERVIDTLYETMISAVADGDATATFAGKHLSEDEMRQLHPDLRAAIHYHLTDQGRERAAQVAQRLHPQGLDPTRPSRYMHYRR